MSAAVAHPAAPATAARDSLWMPRASTYRLLGPGMATKTTASAAKASSVWRAGTLKTLVAVEQPQDAGDGDRHPIWAVVELIAQLVHRLLELEDRQQLAGRRLARRQQRRVGAVEVALQEGVARVVLPLVGHGHAAQQPRAGGDVGERAQHACDVAQRRALEPALGERARGLALEVEDHPPAVREHGLAEVVVAVRADHAAAGADVRERLQLLAHVLPAAGDRRDRL